MSTAGTKINPIHIVGGEKGGVGKTFISRALCHYFNANGEVYALIEADSQIDDVGRIYKNQAAESHKITLSDDPKRSTEPDVILDTAGKTTALVNLPSNTQAVLDRWMARTNLLQLMEDRLGGNRLVKWFVSDGCHESMRQLDQSIFALDGSIPHIVVLNRGRLHNVNFSYLQSKGLYQRAKAQKNFVAEIEFPALENSVQYFIDENELTLDAAREKIAEEQGILAEQRIVTFVEDFSKAFDSAIARLEEFWDTPNIVGSGAGESSDGNDASQESEDGNSPDGHRNTKVEMAEAQS
ncbi:MAG: hypothetical protein HC795_06515 [Coleofasciculaceae cyanobacterium RL_1_1]|nr:hypothetical protein [Coleofasciculaceae cyanobacterium RL_1_1]